MSEFPMHCDMFLYKRTRSDKIEDDMITYLELLCDPEDKSIRYEIVRTHGEKGQLDVFHIDYFINGRELTADFDIEISDDKVPQFRGTFRDRQEDLVRHMVKFDHLNNAMKLFLAFANEDLRFGPGTK